MEHEHSHDHAYLHEHNIPHLHHGCGTTREDKEKPLPTFR